MKLCSIDDHEQDPITNGMVNLDLQSAPRVPTLKQSQLLQCRNCNKVIQS